MEKYSIEPYEENQSFDNDFRKEEAYLRAKKRVESIAGFYWHLAAYIVVNIFLIVLIGLNSSDGFSGFGPSPPVAFPSERSNSINGILPIGYKANLLSHIA